jgi:hypothetical protein
VVRCRDYWQPQLNTHNYRHTTQVMACCQRVTRSSDEKGSAMQLLTTVEIFAPAAKNFEAAGQLVDEILRKSILESSLAFLDLDLIYCPIVMPKEMHSRYPARSKVWAKKRRYDCAPLLDFETFMSGSVQSKISEYVRGLRLAAPHLSELGASPVQIQEFNDILSAAAKSAAEQWTGDQTRH